MQLIHLDRNTRHPCGVEESTEELCSGTPELINREVW